MNKHTYSTILSKKAYLISELCGSSCGSINPKHNLSIGNVISTDTTGTKILPPKNPERKIMRIELNRILLIQFKFPQFNDHWVLLQLNIYPEFGTLVGLSKFDD